MAECFYTTNSARLHRYHGEENPHVRVRRTSPEDLHLTLMLGKRAATIALSAAEADIIGQMLIRTAAELRGQKVTSDSVECPHCHWGFAPSVINQHISEKH